MLIKLAKIIDCSSEHASYPASNLLQNRPNSSWRCAKPGEMLATVTFQFVESSCITGIEISNYRSCVVIVTASTNEEPDKWLPILNHQFLTNDEAVSRKFTDQLQVFTKRELNPETIKTKFDRVKVTCMQSANLKEIFGLTFILFRTEVVVDLGLDVFGRFKLKQTDENGGNSSLDFFKEKFLKMTEKKKPDYKGELLAQIKKTSFDNFMKHQEEGRKPMRRPLLEKLEAGKADEVFGTKKQDANNSSSTNATKVEVKKVPEEPVKRTPLNVPEEPVKRTPFGDIVPTKVSTPNKKDSSEENKRLSTNSKKRSLSPEARSSQENVTKKKQNCLKCQDDEDICKNCGKLQRPKPTPTPERAAKKRSIEPQKAKKLFSKLLEDVTFSLSGYVNPQRDEIRRKALRMGARYIADPNTTNKKCSHLICAFKNTPKHQQLKGHSKIVSHAFIEDCYDKKTRFPWRRYTWDNKEKDKPESDEEVLGSTSPLTVPSAYDVETDSDSNH
ncbi:DNA repair protein XRCC1 [Augochlora pura]